MTNMLVVSLLGVAYGALFVWAFRTLPREEWQILAVIPRTRQDTGGWSALNLTYYGLFTATGVSLAAVMVFVLMAAIGVFFARTCLLVLVLVDFATTAAKLVAQFVM